MEYHINILSRLRKTYLVRLPVFSPVVWAWKFLL